MTSANGRAGLLVVDCQNDFCAGGASRFPTPTVCYAWMNQYRQRTITHGTTVYASRDWHPPLSQHFKLYGGPWPVHCVRDTAGARFHPSLHLPGTAITITKGEAPTSSGYSVFDGHTPEGKSFLDDVRERGIERLCVGGLATDYCVKQSVLDALSAGLQVVLFCRMRSPASIPTIPRGPSSRCAAEVRS